MSECKNNTCCSYIKSSATSLLNIEGTLSQLQCTIDLMNGSLCGVSDNLERIYASLASVNPMAVAAEYPNLEEDKVVYTTNKVRFLDMLNPNMVVLFKGTFDVDLPVYFADTIGYLHIVTMGSTETLVTANELVNNYPYPALYVGNYIILNPTEQTLEDFKNGIL